MQKYNIAPENIEFELSRKLQRLDMQELSSIVDEIHANNFRCALDRFGGDVISLRLLRELDVDTIKLDHRLLSSENNNRRNRFILEGIIKIASQLQIHTVAEGIDNASQVQYRHRAGSQHRVREITRNWTWTYGEPTVDHTGGQVTVERDENETVTFTYGSPFACWLFGENKR